MYLVEIFYHVDNFCKDFEKHLAEQQLSNRSSNAGRKRCLSMSDVMTIVINFHHSKMRTFKDYYNNHVKMFLTKAFHGLVSYNRFVELMRDSMQHLYIFTNCFCLGKVTGISFIDSTVLAVCKNLRISSHKVFKGVAQRGKSSTGWFYGFKLHLIINEFGEIIAFDITSGNVDDRKAKVIDRLTKNLTGKLFGDRGYLSKSLFQRLYDKGIHLFTRLKKGMKQTMLTLQDKLLLNKRGLIETVNGQLKSACYIEHTRHRSLTNFFVNVLSGLAAYSFSHTKPSIVPLNSKQICAE